MEYESIRYEVNNRIATLTLDLPEVRNAISGQKTIEEIESVCHRVNTDKSINVLIITGTDPAFSSGGNLKDIAERKGMFEGSPTQLMEGYRRNIQRIPIAVYQTEVPTIAAVNGPAIGAGCDLALMCDIRVASLKATFGEPFLNVGLIPGDGGAFFLPRAVGLARACELTFTCDIINSDRALEIGLVNYTVNHDKLMTKTLEIAEKIANKPPEALRLSKRLLYMGQSHSLQSLLEQSAAYQALCHQTQDHLEALDAIFEKRAAVFKGE